MWLRLYRTRLWDPGMRWRWTTDRVGESLNFSSSSLTILESWNHKIWSTIINAQSQNYLKKYFKTSLICDINCHTFIRVPINIHTRHTAADRLSFCCWSAKKTEIWINSLLRSSMERDIHRGRNKIAIDGNEDDGRIIVPREQLHLLEKTITNRCQTWKINSQHPP